VKGCYRFVVVAEFMDRLTELMPDFAAYQPPIRDEVPWVVREEAFIRAFPDPGGPPVDHDLFAGITFPAA